MLIHKVTYSSNCYTEKQLLVYITHRLISCQKSAFSQWEGGEQMNKNFALIGAGGYIAPRHLNAIKQTGNTLRAALDKNDSVGILDSYFPQASFFTEFERFDRHLEKLSRKNNEEKVHYISICSPNYLHDSHIRMALRVGADAICEKPLVLNPWNLDLLQECEQDTKHRIFTIFQLRLHPTLIELKNKMAGPAGDKIVDLDLTYITSRGLWYSYSWKGDSQKSGGIATNIGIHFFDILIWIFGDVISHKVHLTKENKAAGFLQLKKANVRWFLSIDENDLPEKQRKENKRTYRSLTINSEEIEFSDGFNDLHTESYRKILSGEGFGLKQAAPSIKVVYDIRNAQLAPLNEDYHPFVKGII